MLTDTLPHDVARSVVGWIEPRLHPIRLDPETRALLVALVEGRAGCSEMGAVLEALGVCYSTARWRMAKKRLPASMRWHRLGRALAAATYLQAHPGKRCRRAAQELGYDVPSTMHHAIHRAFGVPATEVQRRHRDGWEWMVSRWWAKERLALTHTRASSHAQ